MGVVSRPPCSFSLVSKEGGLEATPTTDVTQAVVDSLEAKILCLLGLTKSRKETTIGEREELAQLPFRARDYPARPSGIRRLRMQFRGRLSRWTTAAEIGAPIFNRKGRRWNRWCYAVTILVFAVGVLWAGMPTLTNLRLAANQFGIEKDTVAFTVDESSQGNIDLNGDLDTRDDVLHFYDAKKGIIVNVGLASDAPLVEKKRVAFRVDQEAQGFTDLSGDRT